MRIIAVTQARTGSSRLPGKVLKKIGDTTILELHINRILKSKKVDELVIATTINEEDQPIVDLAKKYQTPFYCGSENDVLDRFYQALQGRKADYVIRLTSDCPLIDAELIDKLVQHTLDKNLDYCSNTLTPTYPDGQDIEVFKYSVLEKAWHESRLNSEREHVTPYIWKNSTFKGKTLFKSDNFSEGYNYGHLRMTVDEQADLDVMNKIVKVLGNDCSWLEYARYLDQNEEVKRIDESILRNEGYTKSINKENE